MKEKNITEQVIEDLRQRAEVGLAKYGRPLTPFNGRDALQDLYEELLDAAQYIKQAMIERDANNKMKYQNRFHVDIE